MTPRARTAAVVAALAVAAGIAVAGAATIGGGSSGTAEAHAEQPQPRPGLPPFSLDLGLRDDAEAQDLRRAAALLEQGEVEQARALFERHDSLEAKLGAAITRWPESEDRIEQLGALYPRSAFVQLHVGIARFWAGLRGADTAWREARDVEPDTPYAIRAGDLLRPEFAPGLPVVVPSFPYELEAVTGPEQLAELEARTDVEGRILHGVFLQRLGRPVSARRVFTEAARQAPENVDALVADAVGRYEKSNPTAAFSRLGPLSQRFPRAATVRFHLGLLLLWQKDVDEAKRQLRQAQALEPGSIPAREAGRFLTRLEEGTG